MSYRGDDVPTLPWSRHIPSVEHDPADKTVVTEDPWFLEQELRALDPNNRPTRLTPYAVLPAAPEQPEARAQLPPVPEPEPEPKPDLLVLTFNVGSDPADPDDSSASVVPLRAGPFRVPETFINRQPGLWARVRRRLFGLACLAWGLVTRTLVLRRVTATN